MHETADPGAALSTTLTLHDLELGLRQRADDQIRQALQIGALMIAGYRMGEIRERLELSPAEFKRAREWLSTAIEQTALDE